MTPQGTQPWANRHSKHNQRSVSTKLNVTAPGPSHCLTWTGLGRDPALLKGRMPGNGRISRARRAMWDSCPARRTVRGESGGPLTLHRCLAQPRPARVQDRVARQRKDPSQYAAASERSPRHRPKALSRRERKSRKTEPLRVRALDKGGHIKVRPCRQFRTFTTMARQSGQNIPGLGQFFGSRW
jgi:hypothetical protein